jgi:hypothetical protein
MTSKQPSAAADVDYSSPSVVPERCETRPGAAPSGRVDTMQPNQVAVSESAVTERIAQGALTVSRVIFGPVNQRLAEACQPIHSPTSSTAITIGE